MVNMERKALQPSLSPTLTKKANKMGIKNILSTKLLRTDRSQTDLPSPFMVVKAKCFPLNPGYCLCVNINVVCRVLANGKKEKKVLLKRQILNRHL